MTHTRTRDITVYIVHLCDNRQQQYEKDLPSYVWQEASHDIAAGAAWTTVSMRQVGDTGTLAMKAHAYSPAVQRYVSITASHRRGNAA